ncbi:MAG: ABC transporter permease, partial [Bacteroidota bacterium]
SRVVSFSFLIPLPMLRNYFNTILRQLRKNRTFAVINVLGLALAMATCMVIAHFVYFHLNFDKYHSKGDRIVRVETEAWQEGAYQGVGSLSNPMMMDALADGNASIEHRARFWSVDYRNNTLTYKKEGDIRTYHEEGVYGVDKEAFDMLDLKFLVGGAARLSEPSTVVLSASSAIKYFDDFSEAVGARVEISGNDGSRMLEVVGIIEDLPAQTHFDFNVLFSMPTRKMPNEQDNERWTDNDVKSYLLLSPDASQVEIMADINRLYEEHQRQRFEEYGYKVEYRLVDLRDIHMSQADSSDFKAHADPLLIYGLLGVALIILIIAWINYLNLSLVKTIDRLKEIGIRKVLGSQTRQITVLFASEAMFINLLSFILAMTFAQLFAPFTERLTGVSFNILEAWNVILILLIIVSIGAFLIGLYPAFMLRTFKSNSILTGNRGQQKVGSGGLRRLLVSLQFIITFSLIAVTVAVYKQITFMKTADLGINLTNTMVIKAPPGDVRDGAREQAQMFNSFKTALLQESGITKLTNAGEIPGEPIGWTTSIRLKNAPKATSIPSGLISMGLDFLDFFELEPVAGRTLREGDDPWSKGDVVINEKLARSLGFSDPQEAIGAELEGFYAPIQVRGVMENHHHSSLHHDYDPIVYILSSWTEFYFVRLNVGEDLGQSERLEEYRRLVGTVQSRWRESFTTSNLDYYFLDQSFNEQYASDERFGQIFGTFALLTIFIACMGLFGLTSFTLQQRTKEIGIRKVLGASTTGLVKLLMRNYLAMIAIAYVIAMPLCWYALSQWLEGYHFRIPLGAWLLLIPLFTVLLVSVSTILLRIMRSVQTNPVDALRYE